MSRKIGIFGGAFDPVHAGHLALARAAARRLKLDKVIFVPTGAPPHKTRALTPARHRLAMLRLALTGAPKTAVSRHEIARRGKSYTFDTMTYFQKEYPGSELYFLCGSDSLRDLPSWHRAGDLLARWRFAVANRPGGGSGLAWRGTGGSPAPAAGAPLPIAYISNKMPAVSSTAIRAAARRAANTRLAGVAPAVERYIRRHRLYR